MSNTYYIYTVTELANKLNKTESNVLQMIDDGLIAGIQTIKRNGRILIPGDASLLLSNKEISVHSIMEDQKKA